MVRGVSFEFRSKLSDPRWGRTWTWATIVGSVLVPLLLGVGLGDLLHGLPIDKNHNFTGNFFDLLTPYGLWTGLTLLTLCLLHGSTFMMLKTNGSVRDRSRRAARVLVWPATAAVLGFVIWTRATAGPHFASPLMVLVVIAVLGTAYLIYAGQEAWSFAGSALTMGAAVIAIFIGLYPNVLVSSTNTAYNLTVSNSASASYALTVMTVVAIVFLPLVLLYQGWSYHVFRARVGPAKASAASPATQSPAEPPAPGTG
jgi:cytochrome d ubiquinol oxidase subunit II